MGVHPDRAVTLEDVLTQMGDRLQRYVRRMVGDNAADDVMQETCLKVHRALPRYRPEGRLEAFVFTIARNACRDHWKAGARRPESPGLPEVADPRAAGPERELESRRQVEAVLAAVRALPPEQREVFLLREESGLSFREIAALTGAPLNTVLGRMHYAMESLRRTLLVEEAR